jgi:hypothetical protein
VNGSLTFAWSRPGLARYTALLLLLPLRGFEQGVVQGSSSKVRRREGKGVDSTSAVGRPEEADQRPALPVAAASKQNRRDVGRALESS